MLYVGVITHCSTWLAVVGVACTWMFCVLCRHLGVVALGREAPSSSKAFQTKCFIYIELRSWYYYPLFTRKLLQGKYMKAARTSYMPVASQDRAGEQDESIHDIPVSFCSISKLPVWGEDYSNIFFYSNCCFLVVSFFCFGTKCKRIFLKMI